MKCNYAKTILKRRASVFLLLLSLLASGTVAEAATYQVTEEQLTRLEAVFSELKTESETQRALLKEQQAQTTGLKKELETSKAETQLSWDQLKEAQAQLDEAKASLRKSEAKNKATERRLKRQRTIWAIVAGVAFGWGVSRA